MPTMVDGTTNESIDPARIGRFFPRNKVRDRTDGHIVGHRQTALAPRAWLPTTRGAYDRCDIANATIGTGATFEQSSRAFEGGKSTGSRVRGGWRIDDLSTVSEAPATDRPRPANIQRPAAGNHSEESF